MSALFFSLAVVTIFVLGFQASMREVGRRRGREFPLGVGFRTELPKFSDPRIVKISDRLMDVSLFGVLLAGGAVGYMFGSDDGATAGVFLASAVAYLMMSSRSMFLCTAWAFADLEPTGSR